MGDQHAAPHKSSAFVRRSDNCLGKLLSRQTTQE